MRSDIQKMSFEFRVSSFEKTFGRGRLATRNLQLATLFAVLLAFLFLLPSQAYAACSSPAGEAGDMIYNADHSVVQWCDGTNWYAAGGGGMPDCTTDGEILSWDDTGSAWECTTVSGSDSLADLAASCTADQIVARNSANDAWECVDAAAGGGGGGAGDFQTFTANGTWTKPAGLSDDQLVIVEIWGGGGGGRTGTYGGGGGGGAYNRAILRAADLGATVPVVVGSGGTVGGGNGGNSSFGTLLYAYGGAGGSGSTSGGGGGGISSAGSTTLGGGPLGGASEADSIYGGGGGGTTGGSSIYGGGGGGGNGGGNGGKSVYGGGGGGSSSTIGGSSIYGGAGGNGNVAGSVPGGGGGRNAAGARGEVRVWVVPAGGSGGGGSDTLAELSCLDGQVASWDAGGSAWECTTISGGGGGTPFTCPAGFTKVENQGQSLGCIQNAEANSGSTSEWAPANSYCFTTYGGRLPYLAEWHLAAANYTLSSESDDEEWLADLDTSDNERHANTEAGQPSNVAGSSPDDYTFAFRCFIPAGANGGGGGGSDTLAGLSCTSGQVAAWNGSAWACADQTGGGGGGGGSAGTPATILSAKYSTTNAFPSMTVNTAWTYTSGTDAPALNDNVTGSGGYNMLNDICAFELSAVSYISRVQPYYSIPGGGGSFAYFSSLDGQNWRPEFAASGPEIGNYNDVSTIAKYIGIASTGSSTCYELDVIAYELGGGGGSNAWGDLTGVPGNITDLAALNCTDGQVASWDDGGSEWVCSDVASGGGGGGTTQYVHAYGDQTTTGVINFEDFENDPDGLFNQTNGRFTPTEAGTYYIHASVFGRCDPTSSAYIYIRKNGSNSTFSKMLGQNTSGSEYEQINVAGLVDLNGSGDYVDIQWQGSGCYLTSGGTMRHNFTAFKLGGGGGGSDTLAGLSCSSGDVAEWDGDSWECVPHGSGGGGGGGGYTVVNQQVFTGTAPTSWTDLNLSAHVGTEEVIAVIQVRNAGAGYPYVAFRQNGSTLNFLQTDEFASGTVQATAENGYASIAMVPTDANGIVEWRASEAQAGFTLTLLGYIGGSGGGGGGSDTLAGLSCTSGQVAKWNGSAWACAADNAGGGGGGTISCTPTINNVQSVASGATTSLTQTLSSYAVPSGLMNRALIVVAGNETNLANPTVATGVTFNGIPMTAGPAVEYTQVSASTWSNGVRIFYLFGMAEATGDIVATWPNQAANTNRQIVAFTADCIDGTVAVENTNTASGTTSPTTTSLATATDGALIISGAVNGNAGLNWTTVQGDEEAQVNDASSSIVVASRVGGTAGSHAMEFSITNPNRIAQASIAFKSANGMPDGSGGGGSNAWGDLTGVPGNITDLAALNCTDGQVASWDDGGSEWVCSDVAGSDTLGGMSCADGQVAKWNAGGSTWVCGNDNAGSGGGGSGGGGELYCWGTDISGALGNGSGGNSYTPLYISDGWTDVITGGNHSCGIKDDGTAWCWGENGNGQLGINSTTDQQSPVAVSTSGVQTWKKLTIGPSHTCGIKTDDTGWCWGNRANGRIGEGAATGNQTTPVQVSGGGTWKELSAGGAHTCGIKADDTGWCWGSGGSGRLGNASTAQQNVPVQVSTTNVATWKQIDAGNDFSCGVAANDTGWCWGENGLRTLGDTTATDRTVPTAVAGGHSWKNINGGLYRTCGVTTGDVGYCWGYDGAGLGVNGGGGYVAAPAQVVSVSQWSYIHAGCGVADHSCGIGTNGMAYCWGGDYYGQIGDGDPGTTITATPYAQLNGLLRFSTIAAAERHTCAISSGGGGSGGGSDTLAGLSCTSGQVAAWNGSAWACAANGADNLGDHTATQTLAMGTNVINFTGVSSTAEPLGGSGGGAGLRTDCGDGEILSWDDGGSEWICATAGGAGVSDGDKGDITVSASGATWTVDNDAISTAKIANDAVTYAKMQNVSANNRLLGRGTAGAGDAEEITVGASLALSGTTLNLKSCSTNGHVLSWNTGTSTWDCTAVSGGGGSGSTFAVQASGTTSMSSDAVVNYSAEQYDPDNVFNLSTDRYQPTEAGDYLISATRVSDCMDTYYADLYIRKNGSNYVSSRSSTEGISGSHTVIGVVSLNGTTDYVDIYWDEVTNCSGTFPATFTAFKLGGGSGGGGGSADNLGDHTATEDLDLATYDIINATDITYSGVLTDTSDMRLKTDIEPLSEYGSLLEKIEQIDTYSFRMKDDVNAQVEFGVMAQELEKIFPELVHTADDEMGTKSVNYMGLIAPMIAATQELAGENRSLKSESAAMAERTEKLEEQVALLNKLAQDDVGKAGFDHWMLALILGMMGAGFGFGLAVFVRRRV